MYDDRSSELVSHIILRALHPFLRRSTTAMIIGHDVTNYKLGLTHDTSAFYVSLSFFFCVI